MFNDELGSVLFERLQDCRSTIRRHERSLTERRADAIVVPHVQIRNRSCSRARSRHSIKNVAAARVAIDHVVS
jgi:hypothetical protein